MRRVLIPEYHWQIKSKRMRWTRHVARTVEERKVSKVLVGRPIGKRPLGRSTCRWIGSERILEKLGGECGFMQLRTETTGGLL
jgi:hypothetical protein